MTAVQRVDVGPGELAGLLELLATERATGLPRLLVTPTEAAAILSVGRTTVYELMRDGDLEFVELGRGRRIKLAALAAFVARMPATSPLRLDTEAE